MLQLATAFPNTLNESACAEISVGFGIYQDTCPEAEPIIFSWVQKAVAEDPRMAASLLRLHFHDCFVNASHLNFMSFTLFLFFFPSTVNGVVRRHNTVCMYVCEFGRGVMLRCC